MFFFRRKREAVSSEVPKTYVYWLVEDAEDGYYFELNYSGEVGDHDFPAICSQILCDLFSEYWVSIWIDDPHTRNFLLPDGERSGKKECFSTAFSRYLRRSNTQIPVLFYKKAEMVSFSEGICLPVLNSYLSDISPEFPVRCFHFYGYETPFEPTNDFEKEKQRKETLPHAAMAEYGECLGSDHLYFYAAVSECEKNALRETVKRACAAYGKELHIYSKSVE